MKIGCSCPDICNVIETTDTHIKVDFPHPRYTGCKFELSIPLSYWERFNSDKQWRAALSGRYAKFIDLGFDIDQLPWVPKNRIINWEIESGIIPDDLPFANSKYWNCPAGFYKLEETETYVTLGQPGAGHGGLGEYSLIVPEKYWKRFTSDKEWRSRMNQKYAKTEWLGHFPGDKPVPESESKKAGRIPDDQSST